MYYHGYLACGAGAFLLYWRWRGLANVGAGRNAPDLVVIVGYCWLSFVVFLHARRLTPWLLAAETAGFPPLSGRFQTALLVTAMGTVLQAELLLRLPTVFYRMMVGAVAFVLTGFATLPFIGVGIINVVWITVLGGALAGYTLVNTLFTSLGQVLRAAEQKSGLDDRREVLGVVREEMNRFLKFGLQAFLALAASIGVSMSILFSGRDRAWMDAELMESGIQLVAGFAMVSLGLAIWLVKPYLDHFAKVRSYYAETLGDDRLPL